MLACNLIDSDHCLSDNLFSPKQKLLTEYIFIGVSHRPPRRLSPR